MYLKKAEEIDMSFCNTLHTDEEILRKAGFTLNKNIKITGKKKQQGKG